MEISAHPVSQALKKTPSGQILQDVPWTNRDKDHSCDNRSEKQVLGADLLR
jgi:hypothetical protein